MDDKIVFWFWDSRIVCEDGAILNGCGTRRVSPDYAVEDVFRDIGLSLSVNLQATGKTPWEITLQIRKAPPNEPPQTFI
jgi:hypothetical protein